LCRDIRSASGRTGVKEVVTRAAVLPMSESEPQLRRDEVDGLAGAGVFDVGARMKLRIREHYIEMAAVLVGEHHLSLGADEARVAGRRRRG
jgi:hypothetical protein